jgi:hypothetical protein
MTLRRISWFPITLERERGPQPRLYVAYWATYDDVSGEVVVSFDGDGKEWIAAQIVNDSAEQFTFVTDHHGETITLRHTVPGDAATSQQFDTPMPLPVEIIGALMKGTTDTPNLSAAVDTNGDVHTMILETGLGLYARYGGVWIRMTDLSPIEQLDIVDTDPNDLTLYDEADQAGNMLSYRDLNPIDAPAPAAIQAEPVMASVPAPTATIVVASAADLPDAVQWGQTHPESRWYIARRWKALGGTETGVELPWE